MGLSEASLAVAGMVILLAWMCDRYSLVQVMKAQHTHLENLHRLLAIMKLAGATTDRHQHVGMQSLVKIQAVPTDEEQRTQEPEPPEPEGLLISGSFSR